VEGGAGPECLQQGMREGTLPSTALGDRIEPASGVEFLRRRGGRRDRGQSGRPHPTGAQRRARPDGRRGARAFRRETSNGTKRLRCGDPYIRSGRTAGE